MPFLSFIMEAIVAGDVKKYLADREAAEASAPVTSSVPSEGAR